jgi:hypothetical protein
VALALTPASDVIAAHTHLLNLDEDALGAELLRRALGGDTSIAMEVLDAVGSTDRDDVAYGFMRVASEAQLAMLVPSEGGRALLDRLYDELTSGYVAAKEQVQADRIIQAKSRRISPSAFEQARAGGAKIFPHRLPGLTVLSDAPISAERRPGGRVWVKLPVRVLGTAAFELETRTLPTSVFTSGIELPADEIVGVRLYDLGGVLVYRPALFLIQVANATDMKILMTLADVAGVGLTLGSGALVAEGATATARVLVAADRVAFAVGTITSVIGEHRGWILQRFGDTGRRFLDYVDIVNSVLLVYGGLRALVGMAQLLHGLRESMLRWRAATQAVEGELTAGERTAVVEISQHTDDLLREVDALRRENAAPAASSVGGTAPTAKSPRPQASEPVMAHERPANVEAVAIQRPEVTRKPVIETGKVQPAKAKPLTGTTSAASPTIWDELVSAAELPAARQSAGGFRSQKLRVGNREVIVVEGVVSRQIPESESLAGYTPTAEGEHATHAVGMQLGENLPEGIASGPGKDLNLSLLKRVENATRAVYDRALEVGATVETKTTVMVEHALGGADEIPMLVGVRREAAVRIPASDRSFKFIDFEARVDPITRRVTVVRNTVTRPRR